MKVFMLLKKYMFLMLYSVLILTLLPGCSSQKSATQSSQETNTVPADDQTDHTLTSQDSTISDGTGGSSTAGGTMATGDGTAIATTQPSTTMTSASLPNPAVTTQKPGQIDYRQEMRNFVNGISAYAKGLKPGFAVVPQNGENLVSNGSKIYQDYLNAVDGIGREDFLYGYNQDNVATPSQDRNEILSFLNIFKTKGKSILITDYCSSTDKMQNSYTANQNYGFISFAADQRELNSIPSFPKPLFNENSNAVSSLSAARNFLYIINPDQYASKRSFIEAIGKTNYDLIILDLFFDDSQLTASDLAQIKIKNNGAARMALCYMSIGEAEVYRYYWNNAWIKNPPAWLDQENPDWAGNYKVKYWDPDWQQIIFGTNKSYVKGILDAGFDGVYLDIIDAFEFYEEK
jgi:cysteinyl-tRNA synthetase